MNWFVRNHLEVRECLIYFSRLCEAFLFLFLSLIGAIVIQDINQLAPYTVDVIVTLDICVFFYKLFMALIEGFKK